MRAVGAPYCNVTHPLPEPTGPVRLFQTSIVVILLGSLTGSEPEAPLLEDGKLVRLLLRDHSPHTTPRMLQVTISPGYEVDVSVHDGLTCRLAAVHPHIET